MNIRVELVFCAIAVTALCCTFPVHGESIRDRNSEGLVLLPGTKIHVSLKTGVNSDQPPEEGQITAVCDEYVCVNGKVYIPKKSTLLGTIHRVSFQLRPQGGYYIDFYEVKFPNGESASLDSVPLIRASEVTVQRKDRILKFPGAIARRPSFDKLSDKATEKTTVMICSNHKVPTSLEEGDLMTVQTRDYVRIPDPNKQMPVE